MDNNYQVPYQAQPQVAIPEAGDSISFKKYGLCAILFSVLYTFCLYRNHSGITYPLFMIGTFVILSRVRAKDGLTLLKSRNGNIGLNLFYIVSLLLLSITKFMFISRAVQNLSALAIFLLMISFIIQLYVDTASWDIMAWFVGIIYTLCIPILNFIDPYADFVKNRKARKGDENAQDNRVLKSVFIGLIVAAPLTFFVIGLLSSADYVFSNIMDNLFEIFYFENVFDLFGIPFTIIVAFMVAYTIPKILQKKGIDINVGTINKNDPIIAITVSVILGVVYIGFCAVQVLYLFSGTMELPNGYTYAQYAHEGFYQLLAVCILNIILVSISTRFFKESKALNAVLIVIAACTYIMIASSAYRMLMYVQVYMLTFLRLFVIWFLFVLCIWLGCLIAGMVVKSFPVFKACMISVTICYIVFAFSNPDYQIAKYDLENVNMEDEYSYDSVKDYITGHLSYDAIPAVYDNEDIMDEYPYYLEYYQYKEAGIREFNYSLHRAKTILGD